MPFVDDSSGTPCTAEGAVLPPKPPYSRVLLAPRKAPEVRPPEPVVEQDIEEPPDCDPGDESPELSGGELSDHGHSGGRVRQDQAGSPEYALDAHDPIYPCTKDDLSAAHGPSHASAAMMWHELRLRRIAVPPVPP